MRRHLLDRAAEETAPEDPKEVARDLYVENFGPRTAGWLIFKYRRVFHKRGIMDFKIPSAAKLAAMPENVREGTRWFFIAMDFLKRRPGWGVEVISHRDERIFRVKWYSWPHWGVQRELMAASS